MITPEEYTAWLRSDVTAQLIAMARADLINHVNSFDRELSIESGCRAHDRRTGGERVLSFMVTRPTVDMVKRVNRMAEEDEFDFNAESIRDAELNPTKKGQ